MNFAPLIVGDYIAFKQNLVWHKMPMGKLVKVRPE
jgi:hypothetical protein